VPGYRSQLGLDEDAYEALREHLETASYRGREYRLLPASRQGVERGTVLIDGRVVRGFPKVPRTLVTDGVVRHFDDRVHVEEKLNGYNVRVADVGENGPLAFTRSGYVCPYTTWWVRERHGDAFARLFEDRDVTCCAEVVVPENPYTSHDYPDVDGLALVAFDLRERTTGEPLPTERRRAVLDGAGVPQVPHLDAGDPEAVAGALPDLIRELSAADREGVVLKSADGTALLKYTTSAANRGDLASAFALPFDYGQEFLFRRIVREAFQAVEFEEDERVLYDRAHALGEAILLPMVGTIRAVERGEAVGERHTVRGDPAAVGALLSHFRDQGLSLELERDEERPGERRVTLLKVARSTTDTCRTYLDGHVVRD
jgi:putative ATP-dependent DNA ligase